ncbi:MAG: uracil-DNA glycosylase [Candidatus Omnitrophica bacterium 4484_70.2]|nr:MAG: uracil-DNA glycosylase [Candidatus Omnitrophica bacterium 4484_70.2]
MMFFDSLEKIKDEVLNCKRCPLYKTRKNPVVGEGSVQAKIMFVGEAPGKNEDEKGVPFCGKAGKVLDELLNMIGIERREIYITNILKCRPPNNRNPEEEEIISCTPFLDRQIRLIEPEVICCLGNFSTRYIMRKFGFENVSGISRLHGKVFHFKKIKIIPLYHPAVATYNPGMGKILEEDFKKIKKVLEDEVKDSYIKW